MTRAVDRRSLLSGVVRDVYPTARSILLNALRRYRVIAIRLQ